MKEAVFQTHAAIKAAKTLVDKPPKFRDESPFLTPAANILKLATSWISVGGKAGTGAEGVLKRFVLDLTVSQCQHLAKAATDLLQFAYGLPGDRESWKGSLRLNAAWQKVEECWKEFKSCDVDAITDGMLTLKTDRPYCMPSLNI